MKNVILYMLIGLPGSGKTTWAHNNANIFKADIVSSDEFRQKLFGDEADQSHNSEVFTAMNNATIKILNSGKNVIYDATNLNRKNRIRTINYIKNNCKRNVTVVAYIFDTPIDMCKSNNLKRTRQVPDIVYDNMLKHFEMPTITEGFAFIDILDVFNKLVNPYSYLSQMLDFTQDHPEHTENLYAHSFGTLNIMQDSVEDFNICPELLIASLLHDIGKLYTKKIDDSGVAHYIGHENYGAYMALSIDYDKIKPIIVSGIEDEKLAKAFKERDIDIALVATIINCHMMPLNGSKKQEVMLQNISGVNMKRERISLLDLINILHKCDVRARIPEVR